MSTDHKNGWDAAYRESSSAQLWNESPMPIIDDIVRRAQGGGLRLCVDLGCGDGRNLAALQKGGLEVSGLDLSPTALARADELLRERGRPAALVVGDIAALPFADGTIDVVTALDVAGQVPNLRPALAEARRVLRSDGLLAMNLFTPEDDTYGEGDEVAPDTFVYRDTLFRYYRDDEVEPLFGSEWKIDVERATWMDPPHGPFRPRAHRHVNHVVYATPA